MRVREGDAPKRAPCRRGTELAAVVEARVAVEALAVGREGARVLVPRRLERVARLHLVDAVVAAACGVDALADEDLDSRCEVLVNAR